VRLKDEDEEKPKDMAKKTTRTTQQRSKEDQWRRRVAAQTRAATPTLSNVGVATDDVIDEVEETGYTQAEMRPMPSVATSGSAKAATTTRATATRTTSAASGTPAATAAAQRRALAASRAARARMPANIMSVEEEMHYVRSDVRSLIILTGICLAIIIVLAFIIK
jgi:hypothetical protein